MITYFNDAVRAHTHKATVGNIDKQLEDKSGSKVHGCSSEIDLM